MADNHSGNEENSSLFGRRSYMSLVGGAVGMVGLTGTAAAQTADTDSVVDLGEQGLSEGDRIDDYLERYFESGVEVRVPEGEYEYHGSGFAGSRSNAAVVGEGEVILSNEAGAYRETIIATDGVVEIRNLTLRGESGPEKTRFRLEAESGGRVLIDNFNLPDGVTDPGDARGYYVPSRHAGVVEIRNSYIANFSNNGIYASSPGRDGDGQVIVENCFLHNNNITGIRLGSSESVARNCLVLNDGSPPPISSGGAINMRGIRVSEVGTDISIENCEIIHSYSGAGAPIELHRDAEGGSGTIQNVLIRNDTGTSAIHEKGSTASGWSAGSVSISGDGNLDYPSNFDGICVGDDCPVPTGDDPQEVESTSDSTDGTDDTASTDSSDSTDGTDSTDGDTDTSGDVGTGGTELSIVTNNSDGVEYEFTTTGEITPLYDRDRYNANLAAPVDEAFENDDGTWTAVGATGGGSHSGDSFHYEGTMSDFSANGDTDAITLIADGQEVTLEDLLDAEESTSDEPTDGEDSGGENWKTLVLDGTAADSVTLYSFRVSGTVERDTAISTAPDGNRWDAIDDDIADGSVDGVLGKGIDGYRYTGNLAELEFDGAVDVTIDDY